MVPGSLFSLVSGFVDYSAKKCNLRKNENFQDHQGEAPNTGLFIVFMLILLCVLVLYFYSFLILPWRIAGSEGKSIFFKIILVLCFFMIPLFNLGYLANFTRKVLNARE